MSGHSKWSTIKHKKAAKDARRGKAWAKLIRQVEVAAREAGTADVDASPSLALAVQKAKDAEVPKDTIERAIARGAGAGAESDAFEQVVYEGYGPNGVALIVEALTDNRNRTAADVRHVFSKNDGSLGGSGAVAWLFDRKGAVLVDAGSVDEDELMLTAADGGAEDVTRDGSSFQVTCAPEDLAAVREAIEGAGFPVESAELTMVPKTTVEVTEEAAAKKVLRLMDALEENDDVQEVYANFDIPERVLEEVAS
jgi:YebC/PmpR family DNA-binding regulatory protein